MSFRLLSFMFKIGHICGITPSSLNVPKISKLKKFYYLLIFLLITYGLIAREAVHLRSITKQIGLLYIVNNISFVGQILTFLLRSFVERKSWISFLENLEITAKLTRVRTRTTAKNFFCCGFLFVSIVHLLVLTLVLFVYVQVNSDAWREFYPEYLGSLISTQNELLSCVLVNMIRIRYKNLRKMVQVHFERRHKIHLEALKRIQYTVRSLKVTVDGYNDLFGWSNLFNICFSLACLLNLTKSLLFAINQPELLGMSLFMLIFITWMLVNVLVPK